MVTIFRIVAAILIAFFIIVILVEKQIFDPYSYETPPEPPKPTQEELERRAQLEKDDEEKRERKEKELAIKTAAALKIIGELTKRADAVKLKISKYYQLNSKLPKYVSDLDCKNDETCAYSQSNGYFFVKYENYWLAFMPSTSLGFLKYSCFTSLDIRQTNFDLQSNFCIRVDNSPMPEPIKPTFDCSKSANHVERAICSSDKLSELDIKLNNSYRSALSRSEDRRKNLESEQIEFIRKRNKECSDSECIERVTNNRLIELSRLSD